MAKVMTELDAAHERQQALYTQLTETEDALRRAKLREGEIGDEITAASLNGDVKRATALAKELTSLREKIAELQEIELATRRACSAGYQKIRELTPAADKKAVEVAFAQFDALLDVVQSFLEQYDQILRPVAAQVGFDLDRDGSGEDVRWGPDLADLRRWRFHRDRLAVELRANGYDVSAPKRGPSAGERADALRAAGIVPTDASGNIIPEPEGAWVDKLFTVLGYEPMGGGRR